MGAYHKVLTLALAAASDNNVAQNQTPGAAGNLTLNGALVSGGIATFDMARRVLVTTASNESAKTLVITGTDRNGNAQSETMTGPNATTGYTVKDFLTVSQVAVSAAFTGNVKVGTNGIASSVPMIVDRFINPANISVAVVITGTVNYSIEVSYDDLAPAWDLTGTQPTWFPPSNTTNLTSKAANGADIVNGPIAMIRLTQNSFTTGATLNATINIPMKFA